LLRQKKVSKEKAARCCSNPALLAFTGGCQKGPPWPFGNAQPPAAPLRAESRGTSLCLALQVLRMQIGYPADLSRQKLRCSARQTGPSPCHSKFLLLNR